MKALTPITVYDVETGAPITGRVWALTTDGALIMKGHKGYIDVPKEGKYYVQFGKGTLERW